MWPPFLFSPKHFLTLTARANQQDRIAPGVKNGQLTPGETAKLENQQKGINKQVAADRKANGGALTASEKKQVNKEQNGASKNIYHKKHNAKRSRNRKFPPPLNKRGVPVKTGASLFLCSQLSMLSFH